MGIVDKSIVRPVLDAINDLRSCRQELDVYYQIVDLFCCQWLDRPRAGMSLEEEETIYLAHELLREYLRFEGNNRRVALWLLTINRCCRNATVDLDPIRSEFSGSLRVADLDFDRTLLAPILEKVRLFESTHEFATSQALGSQDTMGSFYQWIGIYCTYVYPRLREDAQACDRSMVSTLAFLISEFISLKENVSRVAALLLAIKEACVYGRPQPPAQAAEIDGAVAAGTETELVEQILERLGAESAGGRSEEPAPAGSVEEAVRAAAARIESAEPSALPDAIAAAERWSRDAAARDTEGTRLELEALLSREARRSREAALRMAAELRSRPAAAGVQLQERLRRSQPGGRGLLARLIALAMFEAAANPEAPRQPSL